MQICLNRQNFSGLLLLTIAAGSFGFASIAGAQTYSVLYNFQGGITDGAAPTYSLIQSGSTLYGMTEVGGTTGNGTIYQYNLATNMESMLYAFAGGPG